jgi:hypothetical protein
MSPILYYKIMVKEISKPVYSYIILALALVISKLVFKNIWAADQYIIYNLLSLFMITALVSNLISKQKKFFYYLPLIIIICFFLPPNQLKFIFTFSHIVILFLIVLHLFRQHLNPGKMEYSAVPLELMILLFF